MGQGGLGIKILNPSLPYPGVRGQNIVPSPPHHLCGAEKTRTRQSEAGRVKAGWGGAKLSSIISTNIYIYIHTHTQRWEKTRTRQSEAGRVKAGWGGAKLPSLISTNIYVYIYIYIYIIFKKKNNFGGGGALPP